jgi:hypothetical protein
MTNATGMDVTFRLDALRAEQAFLCIGPCEKRADDGDATRGAAAAGAWTTLEMSSRDQRGFWTATLRLRPGWWRFRYYTMERGCLVYAEPTDPALRMSGLDAMLHVSRAGGAKERRTSSGAVDQFLYVVAEDEHVDSSQGDHVEAKSQRPPAGDGGAEAHVAAINRGGRPAHRHGRVDARANWRDEAALDGTQAQTLWRCCADAV